jgi:hypothetical protein
MAASTLRLGRWLQVPLVRPSLAAHGTRTKPCAVLVGGCAGGVVPVVLWWSAATANATASDDCRPAGSSIAGEWDQDVAACESMGPFLAGLGVPWFATKLVDCLHTALSIRCGVSCQRANRPVTTSRSTQAQQPTHCR